MTFPFKGREYSSKELETKLRYYDKDSSMLKALIFEPMKIYLPRTYNNVAERIYNFKIRPDDIWIITYPKCGTTWTQVCKVVKATGYGSLTVTPLLQNYCSKGVTVTLPHPVVKLKVLASKIVIFQYFPIDTKYSSWT